MHYADSRQFLTYVIRTISICGLSTIVKVYVGHNGINKHKVNDRSKLRTVFNLFELTVR